MKKSLLRGAFYFGSIGAAVGVLLAVLSFGEHDLTAPVVIAGDWWPLLQQEIRKHAAAPLAGLLSQILVILLFSRLFSALLKYFGQPQVIGEMIAGIVLGKSVLGLFWPAGFVALFPDASMPHLFFLSQVGLIFFMFVVGLDLRISDLRERAATAVLVSHVSIVVPFLLGALVSLGLYPLYGSATVSFTSFALFMGIAMSITAFPVLARIIQEKKLTETPLGTMAITCAAVDDVTAWCVLAAVLGIVKAGTMVGALGIIGLALIYVVVMLKVLKPLLLRLLYPAVKTREFNRTQLGIVFCVVLASALVAEVIGIHALFGAFLAGTIMPQSGSLRTSLIGKIEDLCSVVLLPIFFAYTGIRTQINLLASGEAWLSCLGVVVLAILGKMVGSAFAARWSGMSWRDSWALGALMNTRGLMELVVLNIGYDLGILSPTIFAIMVVMALVTTTMTGPLLTLILRTKDKT